MATPANNSAQVHAGEADVYGVLGLLDRLLLAAGLDLRLDRRSPQLLEALVTAIGPRGVP
jgi:hypothetical protein